MRAVLYKLACVQLKTGGYSSSSTISIDISDSSCSETSIYTSYSSSEEERKVVMLMS